MDVTIWNRSSFTWARSASDSAPVGAAWLPITTADQRLTPIAQNSRVQRIEIPGASVYWQFTRLERSGAGVGAARREERVHAGREQHDGPRDQWLPSSS